MTATAQGVIVESGESVFVSPVGLEARDIQLMVLPDSLLANP